MATTTYVPSEKHHEKREGELTTRIERQTSKVPSVGYLGLAIGSMALSAGLMLAGLARKPRFFGRGSATTHRQELANFIGLWAPSLLLVGIYNKLVKIEEELLED